MLKRFYFMKYAFLLMFIFAISSCCPEEEHEASADLELNIKLVYDSEPLVILQDYAYPDGRKISFQKVSMFISDLMLTKADGTDLLLKEVDLLDFSSSHSSLSGANEGFSYLIEDVGEGDFDQISFRIGLNETQNGTTPIEYTSNNPLSKTGEYWPTWGSYIFHKAEGRIDLDNNGIFDSEEVFALHIGSDELARKLNSDIEVSTAEGTTAVIEIELDMKDYFGINKIYDIDGTNIIHSLSQIEPARELADNFLQSFTIK